MSQEEFNKLHSIQNVYDFFIYVEDLASKYEVTCDYILEEFILD